jgi:hypothetical protein
VRQYQKLQLQTLEAKPIVGWFASAVGFHFVKPSRFTAPPRSSRTTFRQSGVSLSASSVGASRRLRPPEKSPIRMSP